MINELTGISSSHSKSHISDRINAVELYPGIELTYLTLTTDHFSVHHAALDHILEIDYCHSGRIGWEMGNGNICNQYFRSAEYVQPYSIPSLATVLERFNDCQAHSILTFIFSYSASGI